MAHGEPLVSEEQLEFIMSATGEDRWEGAMKSKQSSCCRRGQVGGGNEE